MKKNKLNLSKLTLNVSKISYLNANDTIRLKGGHQDTRTDCKDINTDYPRMC